MAPGELSSDDLGANKVKLPPNYAFERTVKPPRNHRGHRAAAQRER